MVKSFKSQPTPKELLLRNLLTNMKKDNHTFKKVLHSDPQISKENSDLSSTKEHFDTNHTRVVETLKGNAHNMPKEASPSGTKKDKGKDKTKLDMMAVFSNLSGVKENIMQLKENSLYAYAASFVSFCQLISMCRSFYLVYHKCLIRCKRLWGNAFGVMIAPSCFSKRGGLVMNFNKSKLNEINYVIMCNKTMLAEIRIICHVVSTFSKSFFEQNAGKISPLKTEENSNKLYLLYSLYIMFDNQEKTKFLSSKAGYFNCYLMIECRLSSSKAFNPLQENKGKITVSMDNSLLFCHLACRNSIKKSGDGSLLMRKMPIHLKLWEVITRPRHASSFGKKPRKSLRNQQVVVAAFGDFGSSGTRKAESEYNKEKLLTCLRGSCTLYSLFEKKPGSDAD